MSRGTEKREEREREWGRYRAEGEGRRGGEGGRRGGEGGGREEKEGDGRGK